MSLDTVRSQDTTTGQETRRQTKRSRAGARAQGAFAQRRVDAVERLVRAGISQNHADAWITVWLKTTVGLTDFRAAADYWDLAVAYAIEEHRRGYVPPESTD